MAQVWVPDTQGGWPGRTCFLHPAPSPNTGCPASPLRPPGSPARRHGCRPGTLASDLQRETDRLRRLAPRPGSGPSAQALPRPTQRPTCASPDSRPEPGPQREAPPVRSDVDGAVSGAGGVGGRMAAAAVTRGTPGGKSQGLPPASPPRARGRSATQPGSGAAPRRGPPLLGPLPPLPFPPSRQGAPLLRRPPAALPCRARRGTPQPRTRLALCSPRACGLCAVPSLEHPLSRRQNPPTPELLGPPARPGGHSQASSVADSPPVTAHLSPRPKAAQQARRGIFPLPFLAEPVLIASSSFHLFPQRVGELSTA